MEKIVHGENDVQSDVAKRHLNYSTGKKKKTRWKIFPFCEKLTITFQQQYLDFYNVKMCVLGKLH